MQDRPTSSITIIWTLSALATPFFIRSSSLPGVAITTCTKEKQKIQKKYNDTFHVGRKSKYTFNNLNLFRKYVEESFSGLPVSSRRMMSSLRLVPPVVAMTFTPPMCLLMLMHIWLICRASSRVGTITMAKSEREYEYSVIKSGLHVLCKCKC